MMTEARFEDLVQGFTGKRVLVTGDFCLDRYGRGRIQGVSRETGQPVPRLHEHRFTPGAAGTIAWNLADLGAAVRAFAVLGADRYGEVIRAELEARGVDVSGCVLDPSRHTPSYEKLKIEHPDGQVRELRLDVANPGPVSEAAAEDLLHGMEAALPAADAVVVADYDEEGTGVLMTETRRRLAELAAKTTAVCIATSRAHVGDFRNFVLVPNEYELTTASGIACPGVFDEISDETVGRAAEVLLPEIAKPFFVTRGSRGITVFTLDGGRHPVPTRPVTGAIDITGAGDSALAAITVTLASGGSLTEAAFLGNLAAHITVRKLGITGTATPAELRETYHRVFAPASDSGSADSL